MNKAKIKSISNLSENEVNGTIFNVWASLCKLKIDGDYGFIKNSNKCRWF